MPVKCRANNCKPSRRNRVRCCVTSGRRFSGSKVTSPTTSFIVFTLRPAKRWFVCTRNKAVFPRIEFPKCVPSSTRLPRNPRSNNGSTPLTPKPSGFLAQCHSGRFPRKHSHTAGCFESFCDKRRILLTLLRPVIGLKSSKPKQHRNIPI
jgi:hypothetical protein